VTLVTNEASKLRSIATYKGKRDNDVPQERGPYLGSRSGKAIDYTVCTNGTCSRRLHYPLLRRNLKSLKESRQIQHKSHV
jgi:hypothetical protein